MEEIKTENENDIIRNLFFFKPIYNIDLFTDIPKDKNEKSKNIYLKFYNEHTRKKVLNNNCNNKICTNRYYEQNLEYIKQKQMKNRIQKENEEKIKDKMEKEKHFEYRIKRMHKLYSSKNILNNNNNNIITSKSKIISQNNKNNSLVRSCTLPNKFNNKNENESNKDKKIKMNIKEENKNKRKIRLNLSFDDKINKENNQNKFKDNFKLTDTFKFKEVIVMSQRKYNKKMKTMIKLSKINENELNNLKYDKKNNNEKENNLHKLLDTINEEIEKYKNKINILVIE